MPSLKQILASRANGARSRGPVTPEGKRRSSRNALRHGLLARRVVPDGESREGFETLLARYVDRLQPADGLELAAIREMVAAFWRLRRAWAGETRLFDDHLAEHPEGDLPGRIAAAFGVLADSGALGLVHRYEARLQGIYQRTLRDLLLIRAAAGRNARKGIAGAPEPAHVSAQDAPEPNEPSKLLKTQEDANRTVWGKQVGNLQADCQSPGVPATGRKPNPAS